MNPQVTAVSVSRENAARKALLGIAVLHFIMGAIGWFIHGGTLQSIDLSILAVTTVFLILGVVATWYPLRCLATALFLYLLLVALQAFLSPGTFVRGWVIKGPVLLILSVVLVRGWLRRNR